MSQVFDCKPLKWFPGRRNLHVTIFAFSSAQQLPLLFASNLWIASAKDTQTGMEISQLGFAFASEVPFETSFTSIKVVKEFSECEVLPYRENLVI